MTESGEQKPGTGEAAADSITSKEPQFHKLTFPNGDGRTEYTASNQHNGYIRDGYFLYRTYFSKQVGSLGQSMYEDGQWHSTTTAPRGVKLKQFETQEAALAIARSDAAQRGLTGTPEQPAGTPTPEALASDGTYHQRLVKAGFQATVNDFHGTNEHKLRIDAGDGGTYELRVFQAGRDKIGLRVQYEKDHIINGARTVHAAFATLAEALEHVEAYRQLAAPQAKAEVSGASPPGGVHGFVISSPRMR